MFTLVVLLFGGVITDDFLVEPDSVKGHQISSSVAILPNGNFAVAWKDSIPTDNKWFSYGDVYIRFFDKNGEAITASRRLNYDSVASRPLLAADENGRVLCLWCAHNENKFGGSLAAQVFDSLGQPVTERTLIVRDSIGTEYTECAAIPGGGYWVVFSIGVTLWGQRLDSMCNPVRERVKVWNCTAEYPAWDNVSTGVSPDGAAVVAWFYNPSYSYWFNCFQIVDSSNNLVIPSGPDTFRLVSEDHVLNKLHRQTRIRWLDEDRFAVFWLKYPRIEVNSMINGIQVKLFDSMGDSISEIHTLLDDPHAMTTYKHDPLAVTPIIGGRYAVAYERGFSHHPQHGYTRVAGFLADTSLRRTTGIFRFASSEPHYEQQETSPCVDADSERVVWVWEDNSRIRIDTFPYYTDIHCTITDWDMVGVDDQPTLLPSTIELNAALNQLAYEVQGEAMLTVYSSDGRRVLSESITGKGEWLPQALPSGVYFARIVAETDNAVSKLVILR